MEIWSSAGIWIMLPGAAKNGCLGISFVLVLVPVALVAFVVYA